MSEEEKKTEAGSAQLAPEQGEAPERGTPEPQADGGEAAAREAATRERKVALSEVLPKAGLVFSDCGGLTEVLCKPKIMPLKSATLLRIESLEKRAQQAAQLAPQ